MKSKYTFLALQMIVCVVIVWGEVSLILVLAVENSLISPLEFPESCGFKHERRGLIRVNVFLQQLCLDFFHPCSILMFLLISETMELTEFSFGKKTPCLKYVKVFENIDENDSPDIPASESTAFNPPKDLATRQRHLLVLVMDLCLHAPDTKIAIKVRLGGKM